MPQISVPIQDISVGDWSQTPLYPKLDERVPQANVPDDNDYITSGLTEGDTFEVKLAKLAWPKDGAHKLYVRLRKTNSDPLNAIVRLMQGSIAIATWFLQPTQSYLEDPLILSDADVAKITDYTDLRLQVQAGIATTNACVECAAAPLKWTVSFNGVVNAPLEPCDDCGNMNNTFTLTHQSGCKWSTTVNLCGGPLPMTLEYWSTDDKWRLTLPTDGDYVLDDSSWNCLGVNVMDFAGVFSFCHGWPSQVTVSPA